MGWWEHVSVTVYGWHPQVRPPWEYSDSASRRGLCVCVCVRGWEWCCVMLHFNYTVGRTSLHRCCRACCCSPRIFSGEESVQICRNEQTHPPCVNSCAQQFSMGDKHISFASGRFLVFCSGDQLDGICEQTSAWISGLTDANLLPIDSVSTPPTTEHTHAFSHKRWHDHPLCSYRHV